MRYHGLTVTVPASWPVYHLAADPRQCVRFDQHAVYLGHPSAIQDCPAHAVGRTEAILIEPLTGARSAAMPDGQFLRQYALQAAGVRITATWLNDPATIDRALSAAGGARATAGGESPSPASTAPSPASTAPSPGSTASGSELASPATTTTATLSTFFTGKGFDACQAPTASQMAAWRSSSPYLAYGLYIGGINAACYPEPNLSSSWVTTVVDAGWKLLPLYVGLQAPNNECGCASMSTSTATAASQGTAAANDAVNKAKAVGIVAGAPIYDDMEGYTTGSPNTPAVLAFLQAWEQQLHVLGYVAGVYTGAYTGVLDLVGKYGTTYVEPDDIWFAYWNGVATTTCSCIPTGDWSHHQRLKQYASPGNQTYGGVTFNIDQDYVDGHVWGYAIPSCQNIAASTTSGLPVTVQFHCREATGAALTYRIIHRPLNGTLGGINQSTGTVRYTPNAGYTGSDSFTYQGLSVNGISHQATVTITNN